MARFAREDRIRVFLGRLALGRKRWRIENVAQERIQSIDFVDFVATEPNSKAFVDDVLNVENN